MAAISGALTGSAVYMASPKIFQSTAVLNVDGLNPNLWYQTPTTNRSTRTTAPRFEFGRTGSSDAGSAASAGFQRRSVSRGVSPITHHHVCQHSQISDSTNGFSAQSSSLKAFGSEFLVRSSRR